MPRLAIGVGGVHAVEGFILARYFMFLQVYFHKTRRLYDKMLTDFLTENLPGGKYPKDVRKFLSWDDQKVWSLILQNQERNQRAGNLCNRILSRLVYESPPHSTNDQRRQFNLILNLLKKKFPEVDFYTDGADKLPHKLPSRYNVDDEKAIVVVRNFTSVPVSLSEQSEVIKSLTTPINILRIYSPGSAYEAAKDYVDSLVKDMNPSTKNGSE